MNPNDIIKPENLVYARPRLLDERNTHYCPGCSHGVVHRLLAELIDEMGLEDKTIGVAPVGCAVFAYNYIDVDWVEAAHGRAPAVATALNRLNPEKFVFTYQGDGDLAAIGTAETIHAGLDGTCYVTRQAVHTPAAVRKTKAALKKAIQNALDKKGTSVVEVVSTCNSGWKLSPAKSNQWMEENMFAKYPLGDLKNV